MGLDKMRHLQVGELGEEIAAQYLKELGLRILERRVRLGRLEIDIVAKDGKEWVFVEVKTRRSKRFGTASEAMSGKKMKTFLRAVEAYLRQYGLEREPIRCDFFGIDFNEDGEPEISYYPGGISW